MAELARQIDEARAELARLERLAASATCAELGHDWHSLGGCNCGCFEHSCCSVPVHECRRCGDCDYGINDEAERIRSACPAPEEYAALEADEAGRSSLTGGQDDEA